jgi:uncharacterized membrane protein YfcA
LTLLHAILLFCAGALAGALNAVAGGGGFVSFPTLLFTGVPPIPANTTGTAAMWVGLMASGGAYRSRLNISRRVLIPLLLTSIVGGGTGAFLLIRTPPQTFLLILPWLMLGATLLFAFGKHLAARGPAGLFHATGFAALAGASIFELLVAVYGGYFGGGMGIMILAMLAVLGMADIHAMNALKVVLTGVINGVATAAFVVAGAVYWPQALVMTAGAVLGGYAGAHYAQRLPQFWIRSFVIVVGITMTIYFFLRAYG